MFKHARCELEIITQPLQLVCTGEFYDKWIDEEKPLPIPALISIISLLVHGIFTIMIMITNRKAKNLVIPFNLRRSVNVNFGSRFMSIAISLCILLYMLVFVKYQR